MDSERDPDVIRFERMVRHAAVVNAARARFRRSALSRVYRAGILRSLRLIQTGRAQP